MWDVGLPCYFNGNTFRLCRKNVISNFRRKLPKRFVTQCSVKNLRSTVCGTRIEVTFSLVNPMEEQVELTISLIPSPICNEIGDEGDSTS
jgi:hypothetical protein